MSDSPMAATPYEVLGVRPDADTEELRRAYRRMLRKTHPDTGGMAAHFHAVQAAWDRVGTPEDRADYDRGAPAQSGSRSGQHGDSVRRRSAAPESRDLWAPFAPTNQRGTRPAPREYGVAGQWQRSRYVRLLGRWSPSPVGDPYSPVVVRSAPPELRRILAKALAEEADARLLSTLGIGYTIWHDVAVEGAAPGGAAPDVKLDHVVLGASGLFAVASEDWGSAVRARKGEVIGAGLAPGELPMDSLSLHARSLARNCRVKFTALIVVVPDGHSESSVMPVGTVRGVPALLVQRSRLPDVMRSGLGTVPFRGGAEVFDVRTRVSAGVRFIGPDSPAG
jgi:hypothetical protein